MLRLCSSCAITAMDGRYGSPGIGISPDFTSGMTYEQIIETCETNGYSYSMRENPAYGEAYLSISLGGKTTLSFTWTVMDVSGVAPEYFAVSRAE